MHSKFQNSIKSAGWFELGSDSSDILNMASIEEDFNKRFYGKFYSGNIKFEDKI